MWVTSLLRTIIGSKTDAVGVLNQVRTLLANMHTWWTIIFKNHTWEQCTKTFQWKRESSQWQTIPIPRSVASPLTCWRNMDGRLATHNTISDCFNVGESIQDFFLQVLVLLRLSSPSTVYYTRYVRRFTVHWSKMHTMYLQQWKYRFTCWKFTALSWLPFLQDFWMHQLTFIKTRKVRPRYPSYALP